MTERYKHEYVNCEVSEIIDTVEDKSLTAEEITDRLNNLHRENQHIHHTIQAMIESERTALGKSVLKQLQEIL